MRKFWMIQAALLGLFVFVLPSIGNAGKETASVARSCKIADQIISSNKNLLEKYEGIFVKVNAVRVSLRRRGRH